MALIDLKTDLKSLKYGHDRPGGDNSGQPYIQTAIPESRTTPFTSGLIKSSLTDTKRIFKFLKDTPQGPLFIIKQVGLQLSNPRLEVKKINSVKGFLNSLISGDLGSLTGGLLQPTRLYNLGINTLAQIPVSGFGGHLNRHGLLPIQDDNTKYLAVAQANNEDSKNNRLVGYKTKFKLGDGKSENIKNEPLSKLLGFISKFLPIKFAPKNLTIDNYIGGPGSAFGIGTTLIRRYDNTETRDGNKQAPQKKGKIDYNGLLGVSNQYFTSTTIDNPLAGFNEALGYEEFSSTTLQPEIEIFPTQNQTAVSYTQNIPAGTNGTNKSPTSRKYEELRNIINKQSNINQRYNVQGILQIRSFNNPNFNNPLENIPCVTKRYKSPAPFFFSSSARPIKVPPPSQISSITIICSIPLKSIVGNSVLRIVPVLISLTFDAVVTFEIPKCFATSYIFLSAPASGDIIATLLSSLCHLAWL